MNYISQALEELRPESEFMIKNGNLIWLDDPSLKPSDTEITVKIQEIQLREAKRKKHDELKECFDFEFNSVTGNVSPHEMLSWFIQFDEAELYVNDNTAPTPFLDSLFVARNGIDEDKMELANKIIQHSNYYKTFYPKLLGKYQNLEHKLQIANTLLDVEDIKW